VSQVLLTQINLPMRFKFVVTSLLVIFLSLSHAQAAQVTGARIWTGEGKQQFIFDVSDHMKISDFSLDKPRRLVLDLKNTQFRKPLPEFNLKGTDVLRVRSGAPKKSVSRIVFDLKKSVSWKITPLDAKGPYGKRILVELFSQKTSPQTTGPITRPKPSYSKPIKSAAVKASPVVAPVRPSAYQAKTPPLTSSRDIIVAIDAGHGGKDPGAIGHRGTKEKDLVLAIARQTLKEMNKIKGLKPVLVRDGDYFIHLKNRRDIARKKYNADVFISIHADSFTNKQANGASVFTLSQNGASSATAKYLANKENMADFIGGYNPGNGSKSLSETILTVAMDGVLAESNRVGQNVLNEMGSVSRLHKRHVENAGFLVLKNPDMLSILVETGFISNPGEEKKLRNKNHQRKIAKAIASGTSRYFEDHPIPGTYYAKKREQQRLKNKMGKHIVSRGDTLSAIANRYRVSMTSLKRVNEIQTDRLHVGKVLLIPRA
jgi:N-acetylmuramoyl-L-alanine amidase